MNMASAWDILWPANRRLALSAAFEAMTCNTRSGELSVVVRAESEDPSRTAEGGALDVESQSTGRR